MRTFSVLLLLAALALLPKTPAAERPAEENSTGADLLAELEMQLASDKSALENRLRTDQELPQKLLYQDPAAVATLAVKALEKYPSRQVALLLTSTYSVDRGRARFLKPEEKKLSPARWLADLQKADTFLQPVRRDSPSDETLRHALEELDKSIAQAALEAGELATAKAKAELVLRNNTNKEDWNYGNLLHAAHSILGRAALKEGDTASAKKQLLAAGSTPGSPQLNSFGPDLAFAREMLEAGQKEAVLEYLELVGKFWGTVQPRLANNPNSVRVAERNAAQLKKWKEQIAAGTIPSDPKWK